MPSFIARVSERYDFGRLSLWVAFILLALFVIWIRILLSGHITDDAYISFRYVDRLVAGQGLTFNDGEWVEGFSNPLWVLLLAGVKWLTALPTPHLAQQFGLLIFAGHFAVLWWLVQKMPHGLGFFGFTSAWLLLTPGFQVYATLGLEGPLLSLLLLGGMTASIYGAFTRLRWLVVAALCFGLAGITRPEGPLYAALWGLTLALLWVREEGLTKRVVAGLAGLGTLTLLPIVAYQVFRLQTYGLWVPNTAIAKPPGIFSGSWLFDLWGLWLLALLPALLLMVMPGSTARSVKGSWLALMLAPALAGLILNIYAGVDWMLFGRLLLPVWPLIVVAATFVILGRMVTVPRLALVLVVVSSALSWQHSVRDYATNTGLGPMLMRGDDVKKAALWLAEQYPEPRTLAIGRLGAVSYYLPHMRVWDLLGLTDAEQARAMQAMGRAHDFRKNTVLNRRPELLILASFPEDYGEQFYSPRWLQSQLPDYRCVAQFPQGSVGTLDLWVRGDVPLPKDAKSCSFPAWRDDLLTETAYIEHHD